jgi:adenylate kinase family enzyme
VVLTGLPGTGKSTLADLVAQALKIPAFAGDWLMGALKPAAPALMSLDRDTYLLLYRGLLRSLIHRQLILGQSAILDCVVTDAVLADWRELADQYDASVLVVECVCSDEVLHRSRVEGRIRAIPGWHEIDWDHVERMRAESPALQTSRLTVDAINPLASNLEVLLRLVDAL